MNAFGTRRIGCAPSSSYVTMHQKYRAFAGMVGYEYHVWYDTRHYCGRCATKMQHGIVERMLQCPKCGCMEFSRLFPAVIVGIVDRQTRSRFGIALCGGESYTSYALIAGFSEMGETVEQTVHREVMEEVGLKVTNLRYYKSQPWLRPHLCSLVSSVIWTGKVRLHSMTMSWKRLSGSRVTNCLMMKIIR